jgi:hypothetical protein
MLLSLQVSLAGFRALDLQQSSSNTGAVTSMPHMSLNTKPWPSPLDLEGSG